MLNYWLKLLKDNYNTVIISSGYRTDNKEARVIYDGEKLLVSEKEAGDEALMLSRLLSGIPVITGKDRYLAGKLAIGNSVRI